MTLNPANGTRLALLYLLVISIVVLPIRFHFFQYVILVAFLLILLDVAWTLVRRPRVPFSPVYVSIALLTFTYAFWGTLSVIYGNNLIYLFKDSAGFLVYLIFPVLYIYVVSNNLATTLGNAILVASGIVVAVHIVAFVVFYLLFGELTYPNLLAANAGLASLGFNWDLGATSGILRTDTKAGHYILMGIALLYYQFTLTKRPYYLLIIGIFFVGALLDGHKALIVAIALFAALVAPLALRDIGKHPLKMLTAVVVTLGFVVVTLALYIDVTALWERFTSIGSSSFQVRMDQIESLLNRIDERPFFGNGFGAFADVIRSDERPFMYEVDILAVAMKLGIVGATAYFLIYLGTIAYPLTRHPGNYEFVVFALGLSYLFYMGTNGGFAMSPISSFFHVLLFLCISVRVTGQRFYFRHPVRNPDVVQERWRATGASI